MAEPKISSQLKGLTAASILLESDPTGDMDAATKQYVDNSSPFQLQDVTGGTATTVPVTWNGHTISDFLLKSEITDSLIDSLIDPKITGSVTENTYTLQASSWSGDSQTKSVPGMTSTAKVTVGLANTATKEQREAAASAGIFCTTQATNSLTFVADGGAPSVDIPILVRVEGVV